MEWIGPAVELVKTGSPYLAGMMLAATGAGFLMREMRRHHAVEAQLWKDRYDELKADRDRLATKCDTVTDRWLATEREFSAFIRDVQTAARKAGAASPTCSVGPSPGS